MNVLFDGVSACANTKDKEEIKCITGHSETFEAYIIAFNVLKLLLMVIVSGMASPVSIWIIISICRIMGSISTCIIFHMYVCTSL